jgi:hypothetical protein
LTKSDEDEASFDNYIASDSTSGISCRAGLHDHKYMAAGKGKYAYAVRVTDT